LLGWAFIGCESSVWLVPWDCSSFDISFISKKYKIKNPFKTLVAFVLKTCQQMSMKEKKNFGQVMCATLSKIVTSLPPWKEIVLK
jgi:hypothetical protein